MKNEIC
ncbi:hypothetical protein CAJAP_05218 [Camponotus japonicus]